MAKIRTAKYPKKVKGCDYVETDEKYDKETKKKENVAMKTAGIALKLKKSESEEGYSKKPKVKSQSKTSKPISGQKRIY